MNRWFVAVALSALMPLTAHAQTVDDASLAALTCQQLWYLENEVLAENRVCLTSERARRAFRSAAPCVSSDERILPPEVKRTITSIRRVAGGKGCQAR